MLKAKKAVSLLQKSHVTESKIDQYLDRITQSQLLFNLLWENFFNYGPRSEQSVAALQDLHLNETEANNLRREIESLLFEKTLIPDSRSDVMTLLEHMRHVLNLHEAIGFHLRIEQPNLTKEFQPAMQKLLDQVNSALDHMVLCARSFFNDLERVREYSQKTIFHEAQADTACTELKMEIFDSEMRLDEKVQIRYFIDRIDDLANRAEDIVDRISIYTLKRAI